MRQGAEARANTDDSAIGQGNPTLGDVIENLGEGIVDVLAAPRGLGIAVLHPVIHDPVHPPNLEAGDVVLGVGTDASRPDVLNLIEYAGRADAAGIVVRTPEAVPESVRRAAHAAGVALLGVAGDISWAQLHALFRTSLLASGEVLESRAGGVAAGDLFGLANAVTGMVGGPVTIEDAQSRVIAYSSTDDPIDEARRQTILGRRVPERFTTRLREEGVFRRLWAGEVVRVEFPEDPDLSRPRLAAAVRAGDEVLGSIWVAQGLEEFGPNAADALQEAARIAALHLIRHRSSEDLERRRRGDMLRSVLEGQLAGEVLTSSLGLEGAFAVIAFDLVDGGEAERILRSERAVSTVLMFCEAFRRKAASVAIGGIVYLLIPLASDGDVDELGGFTGRITEQLESSIKARVRAGVSSIVVDVSLLSEARSEADRVLKVLQEHDEVGIAYLDDVSSSVVLNELRDLALGNRHLLRGKLALLADHDRAKGTPYLETLRAYLDAFGEIPAASKAMTVHPNTFRYRLRRLLELSGIDLDDPEERMVVHLQLHLMSQRPDRKGSS